MGTGLLSRVGDRWLLRVEKGRSLLQQRLRSLRAAVVPGVEIELPVAAHRAFWKGLAPDGDLILFLGRGLRDGGLFLDIGAKIGLYSVALWQLRARMRAVAFEPIPSTRVLLDATLRLNGTPFTSEQLALSDESGMLRLTAYPHGMNNVWVPEDDGRHPTLDVPKVSLDTWCGDDPDRIPGAIKIDVEGHELAVLRGARRVLRAHRPPLVLECHAGSWDGLGVSRKDLEDEIAAIGYSRVCDRHGRPVDFRGARQTFHLLAMP